MRSDKPKETEEDAEWTMGGNEWPDPDPSPPLAEQLTNWLKRSAKGFLNLFGGYLFMAAAWVAFFYVAFYASFFLVGVSQPGAMSAGIWEVMRMGAWAVMTSIQPLGEVVAGFVGSVGIVMFAGGAISLWAYGKLKKLSVWAWKRIVSRVR